MFIVLDPKSRAIEFFQINIDLYPNSANVYGSMDEQGDPKKAIVYYKRALEPDPGKHGAKNNIKKMKEMIAGMNFL